jgi:hypothetical protein
VQDLQGATADPHLALETNYKSSRFLYGELLGANCPIIAAAQERSLTYPDSNGLAVQGQNRGKTEAKHGAPG